MTITLYQNFSENNRVDKDIREIATVTGTLRGGSSILNPSFRINTTNEAIIWVNYIFVHEWGRCYFVNDILSVRNTLWDFKCHVDVLSTYKNQIRNLSGIIARQENLYNLYLDDDKFLVDAQRITWTKAFPNRVTPGNSSDALSFIITLAGGADTSS